MTAGQAVGARVVGEASAREAGGSNSGFAQRPCARRCARGLGRRRGCAPLALPAGRQASEAAGWAPGAPGLGEALAREVMRRRLRAELALRGNDPIRGSAASAGSGAGARVALGVPRLGSMRALALGSTTLARTWEPSVAEVLAARFGVGGGGGLAGDAVGDRGDAK